MLKNALRIETDKLKPLNTFIVSYKFKSDREDDSHMGSRVHVCICIEEKRAASWELQSFSITG